MADISSITLPGGGTYDLKDKNAVPKYGMGKNLLRNWYFVGGGTGRGVFPINQRGATSGATTNTAYSIDGWKWTYGSSPGSWSLVSGGISVSPSSSSDSATLFQELGNLDSLLNGENVTASVLYSDGLFYSGSITRNSGTAQTFVSIGGYWVLRMVANSMRLRFVTARTVVAVKLELGTEQTLCHNEGTDANPVWVLNDVPDYEVELIKCQTSTADSADTYANKTLATEQQLAYVETGTTASRAYAVGEYFCWNGLLYRVKTAISSGGTFTVNTNCEQVTGGGINAIAPKQLLNENITEAGNYSVPSLRAYNLFIVQVQGNIVNFRTLVVPPGVSTKINVDATASIYAHVTMMIDLINNSVNVTSFNISSWGQAVLRVWGVSLPL